MDLRRRHGLLEIRARIPSKPSNCAHLFDGFACLDRALTALSRF
jgi:hypothetical protein